MPELTTDMFVSHNLQYPENTDVELLQHQLLIKSPLPSFWDPKDGLYCVFPPGIISKVVLKIY